MNAQSSETFGIAELATRAGVTPRTVRYYVAEGLLPSPGGAGKLRTYTLDHLRRLQVIKRFKEAYLPLAEIRRRLRALSPAELESSAPSPPIDPRVSLLDVVSILKSPSPADVPGAQGPRPDRPPFSPTIASALSPPVTGRPMNASPDSRRSAPDSSVWHRVILAPGVELQYQVSGDRVRDTALERFIQSAIGVLANLPPPGDSGAPL